MSIYPTIEYIEFPKAEDRVYFLELFNHVEKTKLVDFTQPFLISAKMTNEDANHLLNDLLKRASEIGDSDIIILIFSHLYHYLTTNSVDRSHLIGRIFVKVAAQGHLEVVKKMTNRVRLDYLGYYILALIESFKNGYLQVTSFLITALGISQSQFQRFIKDEAMIRNSSKGKDLDMTEVILEYYKQLEPKTNFL